MDDMLTFIDAMMYSMEGKSPSKAIENQERRGQREVVKMQRLPKKSNDYSVPHDVRWKNTDDSMEFEEKFDIIRNNNIEYTKMLYEKMGITIKSEYDDLFYDVILPKSWEIKATGHSMWNDILDNKGRKRASFFYKAAFYDRDAFTNYSTRYSIGVIPFDNYESDASYEERKAKPWYGVIYDSDKEIFRTVGLVSEDGSVEPWDLQDNQKKIVLKKINEDYPEWEDIFAYWD